MSPFTYYLLTIVMSDYAVVKVAIMVNMNLVTSDNIKYYNESENTALIMSYVPEHVKEEFITIDSIESIDFAITTGVPA